MGNVRHERTTRRREGSTDDHLGTVHRDRPDGATAIVGRDTIAQWCPAVAPFGNRIDVCTTCRVPSVGEIATDDHIAVVNGDRVHVAIGDRCSIVVGRADPTPRADHTELVSFQTAMEFAATAVVPFTASRKAPPT